MFGFCAASIGVAQDNFSGVWVLDKGKTHDLPSGLESYTMVVTQNEQQLVVETKLEGDLQSREGGPREGPPEGGGPPPGGPGDEGPGGAEGGPPPGGPGLLAGRRGDDGGNRESKAWHGQAQGQMGHG